MTNKTTLSDTDSAVTHINSKSAISSDTCGIARIGSNTTISWDNGNSEDFTTFMLVKKHYEADGKTVTLLFDAGTLNDNV